MRLVMRKLLFLLLCLHLKLIIPISLPIGVSADEGIISPYLNHYFKQKGKDPSKYFVTNFDEIMAANSSNLHSNRQDDINSQDLSQIDTLKLEVNNKEDKPWASSFFPSWYGGAAGRLTKSRPALILKTLFGDGKFYSKNIFKNLYKTTQKSSKSKDFLKKISPTEKYDLAVGDYRFTSSRIEMRQRGHKSGKNLLKLPFFWAGLCNGVSVASSHHKEPFRQVDVINPDGFKTSFLPNDIKALLAISYYNVNDYWRVGYRTGFKKKKKDKSNHKSEKASEEKDIDPGSFFLILANHFKNNLGTFIIETKRFSAVSNEPVVGAQIVPVRRYSKPGPNSTPGTKKRVKVLMKIDTDSTNEPHELANKRKPGKGKGFYKKVGHRKKRFNYWAILDLDEKNNVIGGKWIGKKKNSPDFIWYGEKPFTIDPKYTWDIYNLSGKKLVKNVERVEDYYVAEGDLDPDVIRVNPAIRWSFVKEIYDKSLSESEEIPVVDFQKKFAEDEQKELKDKKLPPDKRARFSYPESEVIPNFTVINFQKSGPSMMMLGMLEGKNVSDVDKMVVYGKGKKEHYLGTVFPHFEKEQDSTKKYFLFKRKLSFRKHSFLKVKLYSGKEEVGSYILNISDLQKQMIGRKS